MVKKSSKSMKFLRFRKARNTAKDVAYKALKLAKQNRRSVEVKEVTTSVSASISSTGSISSMVQIAQGDNYVDRNGNSIMIRSFQLRGLVYTTDTTLGAKTAFRCLIVRDNGYGSVAPTVAEILQSSAPHGLRAQEPENRANWTVLYDKFVVLDAQSQNQAIINVYRSYKGKCLFDGTASTTQNKGALYLFLLSDHAVNMPYCAIQARVRFVDA